MSENEQTGFVHTNELIGECKWTVSEQPEETCRSCGKPLSNGSGRQCGACIDDGIERGEILSMAAVLFERSWTSGVSGKAMILLAVECLDGATIFYDQADKRGLR